jgi:hypothetical protein
LSSRGHNGPALISILGHNPFDGMKRHDPLFGCMWVSVCYLAFCGMTDDPPDPGGRAIIECGGVMHLSKAALRAWMASAALVILVAATTLTIVGRAEAVSFNSIDNGQYSNAGSHTTTNTNIIAGGTSAFRNWFTFDLSAAAGETVTSAQLVIPANGNYLTSTGNFSLTYVVNDYVGSIAALTGGTAGVAGYTDLGNGPYGQTVVTVPSAGPGTMASVGPNVTVALNASALADLNTLLSGAVFAFALGGDCSTCGTTQFLWGTSSGVPAGILQLEFATTSEVPLPAALPLFAGGLGAMALLAHRRKRKQAAT